VRLGLRAWPAQPRGELFQRAPHANRVRGFIQSIVCDYLAALDSLKKRATEISGNARALLQAFIKPGSHQQGIFDTNHPLSKTPPDYYP
jgi:hypothetical protein